MARHQRHRSSCCSCSGLLRRPERVSLMIVTFGCMLAVISLFLPRWRFDNNGMQNWEKLVGQKTLNSLNVGFESRSYGLMHVTGKVRNSWKAQSQTACTYRDVNAAVGFGKAVYGVIKDMDLQYCKNNAASDSCNNGPSTHLSIRCEEYGNMDRAGMLTLSFSMIGIFMCMASLMAGLQCKQEKIGGVVFGFQLLGSLMLIIFNIVWALRSDAAFKRIMDSAWYPYPTLGVGYYLHLFGGLFMLTAAIFYGILVLPDVTSYDPLGKAIERREKRLMDAKVNAARQNQQFTMQPHMVAPPVMMMQQPQPVMVMQQQQMLAPQPVFGGGQAMQMHVQAQPMPAATTFGSTQVYTEQASGGYQMPAAPPAF